MSIEKSKSESEKPGPLNVPSAATIKAVGGTALGAAGVNKP
jgi:hypothetical protein